MRITHIAERWTGSIARVLTVEEAVEHFDDWGITADNCPTLYQIVWDQREGYNSTHGIEGAGDFELD